MAQQSQGRPEPNHFFGVRAFAFLDFEKATGLEHCIRTGVGVRYRSTGDFESPRCSIGNLAQLLVLRRDTARGAKWSFMDVCNALLAAGKLTQVRIC
jgi:hypothetical protein